MKELQKQAPSSGLKLRGKPKCPCCNTTLMHIYEGAIGFAEAKCKKCKKISLIDASTLEVRLINKAG